MRPNWIIEKSTDYRYNLSNNICVDTKLEIPQLDISSLNTYPDEFPIYKALEEYHKVPMKYIAIGYGLGELIQRIYLHCIVGEITVISPTWAMAEVFLDVYNIPYNLGGDSKTLYISNPNGMTGVLHDRRSIVEVLNRYELVILDEAYMDFANESMIPELHKYPNLLILKTLSKSLPCPGIRLGYCLGHEDIINKLQVTRPSCVTHGITANLVPKLLKYIPEHVDRMLETRSIIVKNHRGVDCHGNFVFFNERPNIHNDILIRKINDRYRMSLFNKELIPEIFL